MPRPKKSVEERIASGARPKPDAPHETVIAGKPPVKPSKLSKAAGAHWDHVVPLLVSEGLGCCLDEHALLDYCETLAEIEELKAYIKRCGYFIENVNGTKTLRSEVKLLEAKEKKLMKREECLGLTPKARKQMHIVIKKTEPVSKIADEKAAVLKRKA